MDCMQFQFVPHGITRERLEALFVEFYKRHFQRPRVLAGYAAMLWKSPIPGGGLSSTSAAS